MKQSLMKWDKVHILIIIIENMKMTIMVPGVDIV